MPYGNLSRTQISRWLWGALRELWTKIMTVYCRTHHRAPELLFVSAGPMRLAEYSGIIVIIITPEGTDVGKSKECTED